MKGVLLDTHVWAWTLSERERLSDKARTTIARAQTVLLSPVSFFEIGQKVRLGKWPAMEPFIPRLIGILEEQGGSIIELTPAICLQAATMNWPHRDPFDRLLAASAAHHDLLLISADAVFDGVVTRLW
ncbi:type II toxin-antitoxin system VapC family toxin [Inquilinus sp. YAF38]|uniref:type II toxin-antitoxin system VapC family toxin n=1 Tax=Inquilinus sp. YAF38 TaxID=3233084 RepID=UPI003F93A394